MNKQDCVHGSAVYCSGECEDAEIPEMNEAQFRKLHEDDRVGCLQNGIDYPFASIFTLQ